MSSRTRNWSERATALVLALLTLVAVPAQAAAAELPLPVEAVLTGGGRTAVVVDLSTAPGAVGPVAVTRDGEPVPATVTPLLSPGAALALVVDNSAAGAAMVPAFCSAAALLVLQAPPLTPGVVVAASRPATVLSGLRRGPVDLVRALNGVRATGEPDLTAAMDLALRRLPATGVGRQIVVLYTTAPDAGGTAASTLATRFRAAGTVLVVVGTTGIGYWSAAADPTGGFFAPAGNPVPAPEEMTTSLARRYLVQFDTPPGLPARLAIRVTSADTVLTGTAQIGAASNGLGSTPDSTITVWWWVGAVAVLVLAGALVIWLTHRRGRTGAP